MHVTLTVSVSAVRPAGVVKTDGFATSDGGGAVAHIYRGTAVSRASAGVAAIDHCFPSVITDAAVRGELYGETAGIGSVSHPRKIIVLVAAVELCRRCACPVVQVDFVIIVLHIHTVESDGDRAVIAGTERTHIGFRGIVGTIRSTRIVKTDIVSAGDGGGTVAHVYRGAAAAGTSAAASTINGGTPAIITDTAVGSELHGKTSGAGGIGSSIEAIVHVAAVEQRSRCACPIIQVDFVVTVLNIHTVESNGDRTVVVGSESINIRFRSTVGTVWPTGVVKTDGASAGDDGGAVAHVYGGTAVARR